MLQGKKEMKNETKSNIEKIEHKYWLMKESNRIVLEIWMFKIDKPPGRADLHNVTLLNLADTENKCDSPTPEFYQTESFFCSHSGVLN